MAEARKTVTVGAGNPTDRASDPLNDEAKIIFDVVNQHENVWLSTAWLGKVWDDESEYPYPKYLARLQRLYENVGAERLFWATDWPWLEEYQNYPRAVDAIRCHANFFSNEEKAAFLGENAYRFVSDLLDDFAHAPIFEHAEVGAAAQS